MPRILIVDDSPTIRKMVRASLKPLESFDLVEAANGLEAIEQVALGPVALMILDLNMPDMHGVDVLKFLRRHRGFASGPGRRADDAGRRVEPRGGDGRRRDAVSDQAVRAADAALHRSRIFSGAWRSDPDRLPARRRGVSRFSGRLLRRVRGAPHRRAPPAACARRRRSGARTSIVPCSTSCSVIFTRSRASRAWSSCGRPRTWRIASRTILRALRQGDAMLTTEGMDALFDGTQMLEQVVASVDPAATFPRVQRCRRSDRAPCRCGPRAAARRLGLPDDAGVGTASRRWCRAGAAPSRRRRIWSRAAFASTPFASGCRAPGTFSMRSLASPPTDRSRSTSCWPRTLDEATIAAWRADGIVVERARREPRVRVWTSGTV